MTNRGIIGSNQILNTSLQSGIWNIEERVDFINNDTANGRDIITYGLILRLDASNINSYPGTGSTWNDLSYGSFNGSLTNSPGFDSSDGRGSLTFNGTNQMITGVHNTTLETTGNMTSDVWFKISVNPGDWVRVLGKGDATNRTHGLWYNMGESYFLFQRYGASGMNVLYSTTVSTNVWYNLVGVTDGTNNYLYVNGSLVGTTVGPATYLTSTQPYTLAYHGGIHAYHNGKIGEARLYNRPLSATEVLKNFNASRWKYGI